MQHCLDASVTEHEHGSTAFGKPVDLAGSGAAILRGAEKISSRIAN